MVRNTITRLSMHGRWWLNDPDCIILRAGTSFTHEEIIGIATVKALSGGPLIISDHLSSVPPHRLRIAKQLIPPTGPYTYAHSFHWDDLIQNLKSQVWLLLR
jgi:alpha-galactosidase